MNPSEKLHAHHEKLIGTINSLADRARKIPSDVSLLLSYCRQYLVPHAEGEEVTLYAACDDAEFVKKMVDEHKELKECLDTVGEAFTKGEAQATISGIDSFMDLLNKHFQEEENVLMPRLNEKLSQQELESIIERAHDIEKEKKTSDVRALFEYDHKRIDLNISALRTEKGETVKTLYSKMRNQLLKHIELEEVVLFPAFIDTASPNQKGPVQVMIAEHREITSCISTPADRLDMTTLPDDLQKLVGLLAVHNKKEEIILYPMINRTLDGKKREEVYGESLKKFMEV
jgi:hemerythrin-like domain-containing protein